MGYYDVAQVCLKGHVVNDSFTRFPAGNRDFCEKCGSRTTTACLKCGVKIRGHYHSDIVFGVGGMETPPEFCPGCGKRYPWRRWWHSLTRPRSGKDSRRDDAEEPLVRWKKRLMRHPLIALIVVLGAVVWAVLGFIGFDNLVELFSGS